jgi:hypothetical protein
VHYIRDTRHSVSRPSTIDSCPIPNNPRSTGFDGLPRTEKISRKQNPETVDDTLVVSTLSKEEKIEERIKERNLIVHKIAIDLETAKNVVDKEKTGFFGKLGFLKPKREEVECESILLFYEPFVIAKANYFLDYYAKKSYRVKVGDEASEVIVFGQTLKPKVVKERVKGILKGPHKEIILDAQERVIHKATAHITLNRTEREIDPNKLPSAPAEPEPEKVLKECDDKARKLRFSPDSIIDIVRNRIVRRPQDIGRIAKEVFEITEHATVYTPIYEARCRRLKTGEIKIVPISGVTGKMLSL